MKHQSVFIIFAFPFSSTSTFLCQVHLHCDHCVIPVESHEKRSESAFRELFQAADAQLWEARLSPVLWTAAVAYAAYIKNRIPCLHRQMSPYTIVTGINPVIGRNFVSLGRVL